MKFFSFIAFLLPLFSTTSFAKPAVYTCRDGARVDVNSVYKNRTMSIDYWANAQDRSSYSEGAFQVTNPELQSGNVLNVEGESVGTFRFVGNKLLLKIGNGSTVCVISGSGLE